MRTLPIDLPITAIESFCHRHHIQKLSLFGSVLRDDFTADSDIDVLVRFDPEHIPGLSFFGMQDELADILGRPVDLHTPADLSRHMRADVLKEAEAIYVEAR